MSQQRKSREYEPKQRSQEALRRSQLLLGLSNQLHSLLFVISHRVSLNCHNFAAREKFVFEKSINRRSFCPSEHRSSPCGSVEFEVESNGKQSRNAKRMLIPSHCIKFSLHAGESAVKGGGRNRDVEAKASPICRCYAYRLTLSQKTVGFKFHYLRHRAKCSQLIQLLSFLLGQLFKLKN